MFEKEAEEYRAKRKDCQYFSESYKNKIEKAFKDGAEFGFNKANEWHFVKDGKYPKEYEDIWICFLTEDDMKDYVRGCCEYNFESDKHIFKYWNALGTQYLETVIAWKEIVPPEVK